LADKSKIISQKDLCKSKLMIGNSGSKLYLHNFDEETSFILLND